MVDMGYDHRQTDACVNSSVHVCVYVCTRACARACVCLFMCVCVCACVCVCVCACMHAYVRVCMPASIHMCGVRERERFKSIVVIIVFNNLG